MRQVAMEKIVTSLDKVFMSGHNCTSGVEHHHTGSKEQVIPR